MKTITVIETPQELVDAFNPSRTAGDKNPFIPHGAYLKISGKTLEIVSNMNVNFEIDGFDLDDLLQYLLDTSEIRLS